MRRKGQVWIETVLYTLVGLAIIGVMLSFIKPAIDEKRDQLVINQGKDIIEGINDQVGEIVYWGVGNSRQLEISLRKGQLLIDGVNDRLVYTLEDSRHKYSEPGVNVSIGNVESVTTEIAKKRYDVVLTIDYKNINITYEGADNDKELQSSSTPYRIMVTNRGQNVDFVLA